MVHRLELDVITYLDEFGPLTNVATSKFAGEESLKYGDNVRPPEHDQGRAVPAEPREPFRKRRERSSGGEKGFK
ncbi:hypothetical protein [Anaeromyxobacter soli]|uniref:hypothetical protein n=1 Tax=Anaeromyxobacter soli TaxID=2922725 RepID=UPI001FAF9D9D|nr:hypothetical protein [Anaeromyxobacter sp. SG29]